MVYFVLDVRALRTFGMQRISPTMGLRTLNAIRISNDGTAKTIQVCYLFYFTIP